MKKRVLILLLVVIMVAMCACSSYEKAILGTWKNQKNVLGVVTETVYVFNEDGTGSRTTVLGIQVGFTYTITEELLTITTTTLGFESNEEYTYEFSGNKLILENDSETISLTRSE